MSATARDPFFLTVHQALLATDFDNKISVTTALYQAALVQQFVANNYPVTPEIIGGLPATVKLVAPKALRRRRLYTPQGKAAMIHAILHIEANALNLALDAIYRFRGMPWDYYLDWLRVAREEAYHFTLLRQHLNGMGFQYGDFPAHDGLWETAVETGYDVLARMALVPRLLEARGLDVVPDLAKRLHQAGDKTASEILQIIFYDEIGHVAVGNRWYYYLCEQRALDPLDNFVYLLNKHAPTALRGPFHLDARRKAGFSEREINWLNNFAAACY